MHYYRSRMHDEQDRARLESLLDDSNPRLHLYTLARARQRTAAPTALEEFQQVQQQIAAAKAGG